jgi:hypothetical protein
MNSCDDKVRIPYCSCEPGFAGFTMVALEATSDGVRTDRPQPAQMRWQIGSLQINLLNENETIRILTLVTALAEKGRHSRLVRP